MWISVDRYLTEAEKQNNADIIIAYYRSRGYPDEVIAGLLGNMERESTLSPILNERGGTGYGLVQWTPKQVLIDHATYLNLLPYENGDNQLKIIIEEMIGSFDIREWFSTATYINRYSSSGSTLDMIGLTGEQFLNNTYNWTPEKLAVAFMVCYERPSLDPLINAYRQREENARKWYIYMGGTPPTPTIGKKSKFPWVLYANKLRLTKR